MSGCLNKVMLIGNLAKDPEIRTLGSGDRVANLRLATSERWRDKSSGETKERTEWHQVVIFDESLVRVVENYLKKGSKVFLSGALQTRKWTDQNGVEKYSTEIVLRPYRGEITLLGDGGGKGSGKGGSEDVAGNADHSASYKPSKEAFELDDEIPF